MRRGGVVARPFLYQTWHAYIKALADMRDNPDVLPVSGSVPSLIICLVNVIQWRHNGVNNKCKPCYSNQPGDDQITPTNEPGNVRSHHSKQTPEWWLHTCEKMEKAFRIMIIKLTWIWIKSANQIRSGCQIQTQIEIFYVDTLLSTRLYIYEDESRERLPWIL